MRVIHVCLANFYIDGFGYQENILPRLHKAAGHDVRVIASTENYVNNVELRLVDPGRYVGTDGVDVTRLPYRKFVPRKVRAYVGLEAELEAFQPDLIFVHDGQFYDFLTIRRYARRHACRVIADCHTDRVNSARGFVSRHILHGLFYRWIAQRCDDVVEKYRPTLPLRGDFLVEMYGLPREKMVVLPFGADDSATAHLDRDAVRATVRRELGIGAEDFVFVTGGKLDLRKNIHVLIERFSAARKTGKLAKAHLIVVGAPDAAVTQELAALEIDAHIRMLGWQASSQIYRYFWAADLAIFPGTHSVLWEEAIGHGLGVMARRWRGMEHLDVGGNILWLDEDTPAAIGDALDQLSASDFAVARALTRSASELGPSRFSYSSIAADALR